MFHWNYNFLNTKSKGEFMTTKTYKNRIERQKKLFLRPTTHFKTVAAKNQHTQRNLWYLIYHEQDFSFLELYMKLPITPQEKKLETGSRFKTVPKSSSICINILLYIFLDARCTRRLEGKKPAELFTLVSERKKGLNKKGRRRREK